MNIFKMNLLKNYLSFFLIIKIFLVVPVLTLDTKSDSFPADYPRENSSSNSTAEELENQQPSNTTENSAQPVEIDIIKDFISNQEINNIQNKDQFKRNPLIRINSNGGQSFSNLPQTTSILQANGFRLPTLNQFNTKQMSQSSRYSFPAIFDCGMCSRERNLCQVVSGIFTRPTLPYGYSVVTAIPAGTCNISIFEAKPSKNYFALRKKDHKYALNGNWKIQAAGKYFIGGAVFTYLPSDGTNGEKLEARGPLKEPLDLMLLYQSRNPGIRYEYRIPLRNGMGNKPIIIPVQQIPQSSVINAKSIPKNNIYLSDSSKINAGNAFLQAATQSETIKKNFIDSLIPKPNMYHISGSFQDVSGKQKSIKSFSKSNDWRNYYLKQDSNTSPDNFVNKNVGAFNPSLKRISDITNIPNHISTQIVNPEFRPLDSNQHSNIAEKSFDGNSTIYHIHEGNPKDSRYTSNGFKNHHKIRHNHGVTKFYQVGQHHARPTLTTVKPSLNSIHKNSFLENGLDEYPRKIRKFRNRKKGKKRKDRFQWIFKGLTKCSRKCGGGEQTSVLACERRKKSKIVSDKRCHGIKRPEVNIISCNLKPCPARWVPEEWNQCSVSCGIGTQTRTFVCKQEVSSKLTMIVPEGACLEEITTTSSKVCDAGRCPTKTPQWEPGPWSPCSKTCGIGKRERKIECIVFLERKNNSICEDAGLLKLNTVEDCDMGECFQNMWLFTDWSGSCSNSCHDDNQIARNVVCYREKNDPPNVCDALIKPSETEICSTQEKCNGEWFVGPWNACNVACGKGKQFRSIQCLRKLNGKWEITEENNCIIKLKPVTFQKCEKPICTSQWYTSEWSSCSCKNRLRSRHVKCLVDNLHESSNCDDPWKPNSFMDCHKDVFCKNSLNESEEGTNYHTNIQIHSTEKPFDINTSEDYSQYLISTPQSHITESKESIPLVFGTESIVTSSNPLYPWSNSQEGFNSIPRKDQPFSAYPSSTTSEPKHYEGSKNLKIECMDRIKNCSLVFRARLCKLKYYSQLCCKTCAG